MSRHSRHAKKLMVVRVDYVQPWLDSVSVVEAMIVTTQEEIPNEW